MDTRYREKEFINKYIGLWAFGYLNNIGLSEGLYRTITSLVNEFVPKYYENINIIEAGCGIGRTVFDIAKIYKNANIQAIDESLLMIEFANKINNSFYKEKKISIKNSGFKNLTFPSYEFKNVNFINSSFEDFDSNEEYYDLILNVNYLDRCDNIPFQIEKFHKILKEGGHVIGCTPLNFRNSNGWKMFNNVKRLKDAFIRGGFKIVLSFDSLVYKEILDFREASEEYKVFCFVLQK